MPFFKHVLLASVSLFVLCSSALGENLYRRVSLPNNLALKSLGLERAWWNQANIVPRVSSLTHVSVDEKRCYTLSSIGDISSFDSETGKKFWVNQVGLPNQPNTPVVSNSKYAMFTSGSFLYALDYKTGDRVFEVRLPRIPSSSILLDNKHVYMTGFDGNVYALSLETIENLYKNNLLPKWSNNAIAWRYNTSKRVPSSAISIGNTVNFVSTNKSLYSVSAADRKLNFQMETDARFSAPLGQFQEFLYAATEDLKFYCVDTEKRTIKWEFTTVALINHKPIVVGQNLYLFPNSGGVLCLHAETGSELWWQPEGKKFLAASKTKVYIADSNSRLIALSRETGEILGSAYLESYNVLYANALTDRIFLAANNGLVVSVREIGTEFPTYHLRPEKQPILPTFFDEKTSEPKQEKTDEN
jgi:outer membrane protein assembly factor BamB